MARNRKGWQACGCCPMTYTDVEMAKGSHYEIGDDDEAPYKRRKKKPNAGKAKETCKHVFVWIKVIRPNYIYRLDDKGQWWGRRKLLGTFTTYYRHKCIGCDRLKPHSRYYVPPEDIIYETVHEEVRIW